MQWKHLTHRHGVISINHQICILCQELDEMLWKTRPLLVLAYWYSHLCLRLNLDTERTFACSSPTTLSYFSSARGATRNSSSASLAAVPHWLPRPDAPVLLWKETSSCLWDSPVLTACPALSHHSLSLDCNWFFKLCVPCLLTDWSSCLK